MKLAILFLIAIVSLRSQEIPHGTQPILIHKVEPQYSKEALDAKVQGAVELLTVIGVDGVAGEIKVDRGLGMGLDEKAVERLQQWRFKPATSHGEAIPAKAKVVISFRLP